MNYNMEMLHSFLYGDKQMSSNKVAKEKPISKNAIEAVLEARGNNYGQFHEHARITQALKDDMKNSKNWHELRNDQKEALEMIQHKIGRILNGNPNLKDSWVDIEGYCHLVSQTL